MAKRLVCKKLVYEITLKGKKQNETYTAYQYNKLVYSDATEDTEVENLSFDDCCSRLRFHCGTISSKFYSKYLGIPVGTRFYKMWIDDGYSVTIHNKNLISFKIMTTYKSSVENFTLEYLMKNLSADEMIEYLKDNGLNVCPMIK